MGGERTHDSVKELFVDGFLHRGVILQSPAFSPSRIQSASKAFACTHPVKLQRVEEKLLRDAQRELVGVLLVILQHLAVRQRVPGGAEGKRREGTGWLQEGRAAHSLLAPPSLGWPQ